MILSPLFWHSFHQVPHRAHQMCSAGSVLYTACRSRRPKRDWNYFLSQASRLCIPRLQGLGNKNDEVWPMQAFKRLPVWMMWHRHIRAWSASVCRGCAADDTAALQAQHWICDGLHWLIWKTVPGTTLLSKCIFRDVAQWILKVSICASWAKPPPSFPLPLCTSS